MSITIRKAVPEDAGGLSELFVVFVGQQSDIEKMAARIGELSRQPAYYVAVASKEDQVIGTAMRIVCHDLVGNCDPFLLVENVVVSPSFQGRGVGKMLMRALEGFAGGNDCNYLILASSAERTEAHAFYESLGYIGGKKGFVKRIKNQN